MAMFMLGNFFRESKVVERLSSTAQNELMNIVTIFLGLAVGGTMNAENFLTPKALLVFVMGFFPGLFLRKMDATVSYFLKDFNTRYEAYARQQPPTLGDRIAAVLQINDHKTTTVE